MTNKVPQYRFTGGPVPDTTQVVLPDDNGNQPAFAVLADDGSAARHHNPTGAPVIDHVYRLDPDADPPVYRHVTTVTSPHPRAICPTCGRVSYHDDDVKDGFCVGCHAFTRPTRWMWLLPAPGSLPMPGKWAMRVFDRQTLPMLPKSIPPPAGAGPGRWEMTPTGRFDLVDATWTEITEVVWVPQPRR